MPQMPIPPFLNVFAFLYEIITISYSNQYTHSKTCQECNSYHHLIIHETIFYNIVNLFYMISIRILKNIQVCGITHSIHIITE